MAPPRIAPATGGIAAAENPVDRLEELIEDVDEAKRNLARAAELRTLLPFAVFFVGLLTGKPLLGAVLGAGLYLYEGPTDEAGGG